MKISKLTILTLALAVGMLVSCGKEGCTDPTAPNYNPEATKDDGSCEEVANEFLLTGTLSENKTLDASHIWTLERRFIVPSGVTLTIPAGTIIKATPGTGANATSLIIARGGTINAEGTADSPIIFTSTSDNISIGQSFGSSLSEKVRGLWGGLLILGNAPCSFSGDVVEQQIE